MTRLLLKGEEPLFCVPCHESLSLERVLLYCSDLIDAKDRSFQTSSLKMLYRHVSQDIFSGKLAFLANCNRFGIEVVVVVVVVVFFKLFIKIQTHNRFKIMLLIRTRHSL